MLERLDIVETVAEVRTGHFGSAWGEKVCAKRCPSADRLSRLGELNVELAHPRLCFPIPQNLFHPRLQ